VLVEEGAMLAFALAGATVARVGAIRGMASGGSYCVMLSRDIAPVSNSAFPTAEIAVMGPEGAVNILYKRELPADAPPEKRAKKVAEYIENFANPYVAPRRGYIDEIIEPSETREKLIAAFKLLENKRVSLPAKKHGNIPL